MPRSIRRQETKAGNAALRPDRGKACLWSWILLVCILLPDALRAQPASPWVEVGLPFFTKRYAPQDYGAHPQNWGIAQNPEGIIYVANISGVLEFDGEFWRLIPTRTGTPVLSIDVSPEGTVYVGSQGDFGYLSPDSTGTLRYVSLIDHVAATDRDFSGVWGTHVSESGVYFQSQERLFRWDGSKMYAFASDSQFHTSFVVNNRFFVREKGVGLLEQVDETLRLVPGGEAFQSLQIFVMAPFLDGRILIGTRTGFFLYDGFSFTPFQTEADKFLPEMLYHGCALPDGYFALATRGNGVLLMDSQGKLYQVLDKSGGLPDDWVNFLYLDRQDGLWMALESKGIVRVEARSQLSVFNQNLGLDGSINNILRHKGTLYTATSTGLYYLERSASAEAKGGQAHFRPVPDIPPSWSLVSLEDELLVATAKGIYALRGEKAKELVPDEAYVLLPSERQKDLIYVGTKEGLATMQRSGPGWRLKPAPDPIREEVYSIVEERDGTIWYSTQSGKVVQMQFAPEIGANPLIQIFDGQKEFGDSRVIIALVGGKALFATAQGGFRFRGDDSVASPQGYVSFSPDTLIVKSAEKVDPLRSIHSDDADNVWMVYSDRVVVAEPQAEGSYSHTTPLALRYPKARTSEMLIEDSGVVWLANGDVLVRYDTAIRKTYDGSFTALIRRVRVARGGRTIFGGAASNGADSDRRKPFISNPELAYAANHLVFEFAAPSFNATTANQYQYFLSGYSKAWSPWSLQTQRSYVNLQEGRYVFHVRARNGQGMISSEAQYAFRILPPWYRSWWAYLTYVAALAVFVAFSVRHRRALAENRRAREQARELARERVLNERLQQANQRLQQANQSLVQADKLKDEFLANTSHELRTPITAILGFTAILKEEAPEKYHEFLDIIDENGTRLLHTVNSVLDFARLRAGMMELKLETVDVSARTDEVMRLLSALAVQKGITLELAGQEQPLYARLDSDYYGRILYNLIGNAIKFTDTGGVTVALGQEGEQIYIRVIDTGIGIEEAFLPNLFKEFSQESTGLARSHEGSGLGLAITAKLVRLMGGEISVTSTKGKGSVFTVTFPVYHPSSNSRIVESA